MAATDFEPCLTEEEGDEVEEMDSLSETESCPGLAGDLDAEDFGEDTESDGEENSDEDEEHCPLHDDTDDECEGEGVGAEERVDNRVEEQLVEELGNRRKLGNEAFDEGSVMAAINIYQVNTSIQKEGITCTGGTSQTTSIQRMS